MKDSGVPLPPALIHTAAAPLLTEERRQLKLSQLGNRGRKFRLERKVMKSLAVRGKSPHYPRIVTVTDSYFHSHANTPPQG